MTWWYWLSMGLVLMALEMVAPSGFYLMFFGLSALAVGALTGVADVEPEWLQWVLFSGLAVVSLLLFRGPLLARLKTTERKGAPVDTMVGEIAMPLDDLLPGGTGKAEVRGSAWTVRNAGQVGILKGQRSRVVRVDGLTLWIEPES